MRQYTRDQAVIQQWVEERGGQPARVRGAEVARIAFGPLPPNWEPWAGPLAGLVAGVVGGITNVPGTPLAMYFYALGMGKADFLASTAFTFLVYKLVQIAAVAWYGLLTSGLAAPSLALTG